MEKLKVYAFTNFGLTEGEVVKERIDKFTGKVQFKISIAEVKDYNIWFTENQLFESKFKAILSLLKRK